jgi:protein ImuB
MPFASIFVPDFPVEAVLRVEPELRSRMVAVLESKPPLQKVFALTESARRAGLEIAMTRLQAEGWPDLVLRCRSALQESAAHAALLDCAQSFSPRVEDTAPDTVVLDISGMESLFGQPAKLARDLARRASDLGLEANVAVASNPDAATIAARGFSGVTVIADGQEEGRLGNLPLDVLFPNQNEEREQFVDKLERWGIRNLRAFAALPELAISERLGKRGVYLQKLARGATSRTIVPVDPPLVFEEVVELEYPLVLLEPLAFLLNRLLEQICARLSARTLATQELRLKLELENGIHEEECESTATRPAQVRTFTRTLRLPVPMLDAKVFLKLLQLDLQANPPGAPIKKIWLWAEPARSRAAQGGLFLPPSPEPEKLELTLARISGIVGEGKAGSVQLLDTHRPEAFCIQHFTPAVPEQKKNHAEPEKNAAITALRMFRPRLSATVTLRDGKPAAISCPRKKEVQGEVIWQAGPWRSSGDWWEQTPWARDEWDIALQTASGVALFRLVRDLLAGRWFVEGTYD